MPGAHVGFQEQEVAFVTAVVAIALPHSRDKFGALPVADARVMQPSSEQHRRVASVGGDIVVGRVGFHVRVPLLLIRVAPLYSTVQCNAVYCII